MLHTDPSLRKLLVSCGVLPDPDNRTVTLNGTLLGSIATYTCDSGYAVVDDVTRICQTSGTWSRVAGCLGETVYSIMLHTDHCLKGVMVNLDQELGHKETM